MDPAELELKVKRIQRDAYVRLLRVICVQEYNWDTEELLTNTRKMLNISNAEHAQFIKDCRPGGKYALQLEAPPPPQQLPPHGNPGAAGNGYGMQQDAHGMLPGQFPQPGLGS